MSSYKRPFHFPPQPLQPQGEKPWLKYPASEKSSNVHSRTINAPSELTLTRSHSQNHGHSHHVSHRSDSQSVGSLHKSSSKLHSSNSSNASLPMSIAGSNSSSDSLGYHSHPQPLKSNKPRSLEDELSSAFHNNNNSDTSIGSKPTTYQSPVTPSDLLNINTSAFSNASSSNSSSTTLTPSGSPLQRADSTSRKQRPSPLSINTALGDNNPFEGASIFPQGSPISVRGSTNSDTLGSPRVNIASTSGHQTPRLSHSSHSSTASNSSYSNPSSPSSVTSPPCSALCHHTKSHNHTHSHSHQHHHHHSCSHNKHDRSHRHHHSCHHSHSSSHRHGSRSDRAAKSTSRYEHNEESQILEEDESQLAESPKEMASGLDVTPPSTTTAVTIVGSTPAFGIGAFREGEDQENNALGLYSTEPPKKRQRSAAAALFGAAFETVIFTSAVALSAYQLLTGKGRQLEDTEMEPAQENPATIDDSSFVLKTERSVVQIKTAPVNIPTRSNRHRDSSMLGKSLHHNHAARSHHHKHSSRSRHGFASSLPHADAYDHMKANLGLPDRPNTGTEDSDEQFLRMEAQLTTLIAEGKRALSTRISDWR